MFRWGSSLFAVGRRSGKGGWAKAGLLTCSGTRRLPGPQGASGKESRVRRLPEKKGGSRNLQQRELSGILTRFPFHPGPEAECDSAGRIRNRRRSKCNIFQAESPNFGFDRAGDGGYIRTKVSLKPLSSLRKIRQNPNPTPTVHPSAVPLSRNQSRVQPPRTNSARSFPTRQSTCNSIRTRVKLSVRYR